MNYQTVARGMSLMSGATCAIRQREDSPCTSRGNARYNKTCHKCLLCVMRKLYSISSLVGAIISGMKSCSMSSGDIIDDLQTTRLTDA